MSGRKNRSRSNGGEKFVAVRLSMMQTAAWRDLDCFAVAAYIELSRRYGGPASNNGRIPYSVREMAGNLNVSQSTAMRAFRQLKDRGFIVEMRRGRYGRKRRLATEWRLTEFPCDVTGERATKDYEQWTGAPRASHSTDDFVYRAQGGRAA